MHVPGIMLFKPATTDTMVYNIAELNQHPRGVASEGAVLFVMFRVLYVHHFAYSAGGEEWDYFVTRPVWTRIQAMLYTLSYTHTNGSLSTAH